MSAADEIEFFVINMSLNLAAGPDPDVQDLRLVVGIDGAAESTVFAGVHVRDLPLFSVGGSYRVPVLAERPLFYLSRPTPIIGAPVGPGTAPPPDPEMVALINKWLGDAFGFLNQPLA